MASMIHPSLQSRSKPALQCSLLQSCSIRFERLSPTPRLTTPRALPIWRNLNEISAGAAWSNGASALACSQHLMRLVWSTLTLLPSFLWFRKMSRLGNLQFKTMPI
jgi:hypothetical protein